MSSHTHLMWIFSVKAINRGTLPTGSIITKRAIVDLIKFSIKLDGITNTGNDNDCGDDNDTNNIQTLLLLRTSFSEYVLILLSYVWFACVL